MVVWRDRSSAATVRRVIPTEHPGHRLTGAHRIRFLFEAETLRQAVSAAGRLRSISPDGVKVRPARLSRAGACPWAVLVTTDPLEASAIASVEDELRRIASRAPGVSFTGWLALFGRGESVLVSEPAASLAAHCAC
jgi:hypothetical protein